MARKSLVVVNSNMSFPTLQFGHFLPSARCMRKRMKGHMICMCQTPGRPSMLRRRTARKSHFRLGGMRVGM